MTAAAEEMGVVQEETPQYEGEDTVTVASRASGREGDPIQCRQVICEG